MLSVRVNSICSAPLPRVLARRTDACGLPLKELAGRKLAVIPRGGAAGITYGTSATANSAIRACISWT